MVQNFVVNRKDEEILTRLVMVTVTEFFDEFDISLLTVMLVVLH